MSVVPTPAAPGDETKELAQLERLYDHTKFHIALSVTLALAYLVLMLSDYGRRVFSPNGLWVDIAIRAFLVAGFAGGVIASSCPHYTSFARLMADRIFPYFGGQIVRRSGLIPRGRTWVTIQHAAFWVGLAAVLLSFGLHPFALGVPDRAVVAEGPTAGYAMVLEWQVSGRDYRKLADLGSDRDILVCAESEGGVELQIDQAGGKKLAPKKAGGPPEVACQGALGQAVSAKSRDSEPQKGRLFIR